jgi:hypothetical protein
MFIMNGCCVLFLTALSLQLANCRVKFETLELATDSFGQTDIYAPHTAVESRLIDEKLFGFMLNSVVQVQTPEFLLASGICAPYTVIRYNGGPAVVSAPCNDEEWARLVTPSETKILPIKNFEAVRYDFLDRILYTLRQGLLTKHFLDGRFNAENITMGAITDFYSSGGELFYIRAKREFRRADGVTEQIGISESGRHRKYYIPSSEASCGTSVQATVVPMLALIFHWLGAYDSFVSECRP